MGSNKENQPTIILTDETKAAVARYLDKQHERQRKLKEKKQVNKTPKETWDPKTGTFKKGK